MSHDPQVRVLPGGPVSGSIRPPGSKSLTNRALICAAFAAGDSTLSGALRSEDTEVMIAALRDVGIPITVHDAGRTLHISGKPQLGRSAGDPETDLFIANSGTTIRFLTAALSAAGGHYRLHGVPRMHQRPIADLVDALAVVQTGVIETQSPGGCPPVVIASDGWSQAQVQVAGSVSSQYLSGLMMAAPIANLGSSNRETRIGVLGPLVSRPYVDMTCRVMNEFGADTQLVESELDAGESICVRVGPQGYRPRDYAIEPDASAASYFWAAAGITGGDVTVEGLSRDAIQGDVRFCEVLQAMGCQVDFQPHAIRVRGRADRGVDIDMNAISDTVQTLAVVALFADGPTRVRGVAHNRFKETDRIGDLANELRKLQAGVQEHDDGLTIRPPTDHEIGPVTLDTYHDHRMAMSLSLAGLRLDGVAIRDPACTAKTYPEYFADLERLIGRPHQWV